MTLRPYLDILRIRGVPGSMLLMFLARLPMTAMSITMTLHVVSELGLGYGAAGVVGAITTGATACGAPLLGRAVDRYGLRPVVALCAVGSTTYWTLAPHLPYQLLLVCALPAGLLTIPASSLAKQVMVALVPPAQRRSALSMDSMSIELTFMTGPALGIGIATQLSTTAAMTAIGMAYAVSGTALWLTNPPVRQPHENESTPSHRPPVRQWLGRRLIATYIAAFGALFVLIGTELAALAALRAAGQVEWTGLVIAVMCAASLLGGLVHGAVRRSLPQAVLMLLLGLLTVPVALAVQPWWLLALVLIPTNLMCAPTLAATAEATSTYAPSRVRGEAMGLQGTSTMLGIAVGQPVIGLVLDQTSPAWGFVVSGAVGVALAGLSLALQRRARRGTTDSGRSATGHTGAAARTVAPLSTPHSGDRP